MKLCLTFDNGPEPEATPRVLEVLAARGIRSTFFVIGVKLRDPARLALAERAVAEGHRVGNHTLTHGAPLGRRTAEEALAEVMGAEAMLGGLNPGRLFRPNGGGGALGPHLLHHQLLPYLVESHATVVLWNAVPRDWNDPEGWPDRALAMHAAAASPLLMVLHDVNPSAMAALDRTLGRLVDAGAEFVQDFPPDCLALQAGRWLCDPALVSSGG